jgi:hypothetical protein
MGASVSASKHVFPVSIFPEGPAGDRGHGFRQQPPNHIPHSSLRACRDVNLVR